MGGGDDADGGGRGRGVDSGVRLVRTEFSKGSFAWLLLGFWGLRKKRRN